MIVPKAKMTPPRRGALQHCLLLGQLLQLTLRHPFPPPGLDSLPKGLFIFLRKDSFYGHGSTTQVGRQVRERTHHVWMLCLQASKPVMEPYDQHCVTGDCGYWARCPFSSQVSLLQVYSSSLSVEPEDFFLESLVAILPSLCVSVLSNAAATIHIHCLN